MLTQNDIIGIKDTKRECFSKNQRGSFKTDKQEMEEIINATGDFFKFVA